MEWWQDLYDRQTYFDLYEKQDTALAPQQVEKLVKLLKIQPPAKILDVCCGYGRHSIELAKRGFDVVGVDISERQIKRAKEIAGDMAVSFQIADIRGLNFKNEFDIAVNMFLSFGYFQTADEDIAALESVLRALKPGGKFLMDFWNREKEIRNFKQTKSEKIGDISILKEWKFDYLRGRLNWRNTVTFPGGRKETFEHSIRAYTVVELKQLFERVGFEFSSVYGSLYGEPFSID
jgi:SAM-dependent methyltransferase